MSLQQEKNSYYFISERGEVDINVAVSQGFSEIVKIPPSRVILSCTLGSLVIPVVVHWELGLIVMRRAEA